MYLYMYNQLSHQIHCHYDGLLYSGHVWISVSSNRDDISFLDQIPVPPRSPWYNLFGCTCTVTLRVIHKIIPSQVSSSSLLFLLNLTIPMLTDMDTSGSEIYQDQFQDISPAGISIPLRTLVQTNFTTRKVIHHPSSKYDDTPRCLGLACDGSYLACGYDTGRFEVLVFIHSPPISSELPLDSKDWRRLEDYHKRRSSGENYLYPLASDATKDCIFLLQPRKCSYYPALGSRGQIFSINVLALPLNLSHDNHLRVTSLRTSSPLTAISQESLSARMGLSSLSPFTMTKRQMFFLS